MPATALRCADPLAHRDHRVAAPIGFTDVQLAGPYRRWEHTHRLTPLTVRPRLTAIFDFRARRTEAHLQ